MTTLLPLSRTGSAWVRIWDFPRVHLAALSALGFIGMRAGTKGGLLDRCVAAALAGCCAYQIRKILPYTPLHRHQVVSARNAGRDRRIRLLTYNVYMYNRRAADALRMLREADPDVICLLETDEWWEEQMRPLERDYRYTNKCPMGNTYGMLLYSRLRLTTSQTRRLVQEDVPSFRSVVRLRSGEEIVLHTVHPRPPVPPRPSDGRDAELVLAGREICSESRPAIIMGDLNDVAWSDTTALFQKISGMLDPRIGRGLYNSFQVKSLLRFPLDHVFHTSDFTLVELRRLERCGSDHFPILIELAYAPERTEEQKAPAEEPEDREHAKEILENAFGKGASDRPGPETPAPFKPT